MRASELGKVSRDKRRRATTSDDTIAADRDERNRRRSQREAPKPRVTNTSDATREAMATFRLDATGRPCRRMRQECREGVASITTKRIARRQLSSQWLHHRNSCASKQTGGPSSTRSLEQIEQIGQIHAPDLLRRERRGQQQKQKQAAKTSTTAMTRGTRVTRATLAARTARAS